MYANVKRKLTRNDVYLQADVYDHMDYILTSLDMFAGIAENLINYTFNVSSFIAMSNV